MRERFVYLAGPILGCTEGEAKDWREQVDYDFRHQTTVPGRLVAISPLRCEPAIDGAYYKGTYDDPKFGTGRAIVAKNLFDTKACDMALIYLPKPAEGRHQSYGTMMELAWAFALGKPTILVSDDPEILGHSVVTANASWILDSLDEAVDLIVGILGGYVGGKNV